MIKANLANLTPRELEIVFEFRHLGNSNKHIARRLGISEGTVKVHLVSIFTKLRITSRTTLVALAWTNTKRPRQLLEQVAEA